MVQKAKPYVSHHCPGKREGYLSCNEKPRPYAGASAIYCQHYEECPKHPGYISYTENSKTYCKACRAEETLALKKQRDQSEAERVRMAAQQPTKEALRHQQKNEKTLQKYWKRLLRVKKVELVGHVDKSSDGDSVSDVTMASIAQAEKE